VHIVVLLKELTHRSSGSNRGGGRGVHCVPQRTCVASVGCHCPHSPAGHPYCCQSCTPRRYSLPPRCGALQQPPAPHAACQGPPRHAAAPVPGSAACAYRWMHACCVPGSQVQEAHRCCPGPARRTCAPLPLCSWKSGCPSLPPRPKPKVYSAPSAPTSAEWNLAAARLTMRTAGGHSAAAEVQGLPAAPAAVAAAPPPPSRAAVWPRSSMRTGAR
jgi:hypothetical protein